MNFIEILKRILIFPYIIEKIIKRRKLRKELLKDGTSDFEGVAGNIVNSISKSKKLHKELIGKIHADRFTDETLKFKAGEIATRVNLARRDYAELIKLKVEVDNFISEFKD
jgi:hypothetical protein